MRIFSTVVFLLILLEFTSGFAQQTAFQWQPVAPGVWKSVVGASDGITPLGVADVKPRLDGLQKLGDMPFPVLLNESVHEKTDNKTLLRFPLKPGEQLFGLGLNF
jgi:hypothetical protein